MTTFEELYKRLAKAAVNGKLQEETENVKTENYNPSDLDCLLSPKHYAPVYKAGNCSCSNEPGAKCADRCLFDAITISENGNIDIDKNLCTGCGVCVANCKAKKLTESKEVLPVIKALQEHQGPVYALIAPAFHGQWSQTVTPGKLRGAFKALGFSGMIEVALFADILTLKEALEFDRNVKKEGDFHLTSCCCPMWIAMIKKVYNDLMPHVPGSVSPMIAAGRTLKRIHPNALAVFVGPCIAKKAEAREKDVAGAVDFVLTFQEMQDIFNFAGIRPEEMPETIKDHSSRAGRIYARAGGVSEAVELTLSRLNPSKKVKFKAEKADGVPDCKDMIASLKSGKIKANFFEGMGCSGGCIGGPKVITTCEVGRENIEYYGNEASYLTPIDNPYVIELLQRLGLNTIEQLSGDSEIFTRKF